jgi:hypothetical protein
LTVELPENAVLPNVMFSPPSFIAPITADEILRAADTADKTDRTPVSHPLLSRVVMPAVEQAERIFCTALTRINIEDLAHSAASLPTQEQDRPDSIVTEPDSVKQSRARDRRVVLTKIG